MAAARSPPPGPVEAQMQIVTLRFSCQTVEEHKMNTDPKKWNPFKFLRGSGRKPEADSAQSPPDSEPSRVPWPDISRLFPRDPWRAMEDFCLFRNSSG